MPRRRRPATRHEPFTTTYARSTLAGWINAILEAGLVLEAIAEPQADEQTARAHPEVADTRIAPYFLIPRARKPTDHHIHQTRPG
jgi:hypothetical protein